MALKIVSGVQARPQKVVIYGVEGIGKSTLASQFPAPLFIDVEGGTSQLNVPRIANVNSWPMLMQTVEEVANTDAICQTLVLDTADWAERLCVEHVCQKLHVTGIEDVGYGKGYTYLQEEFSKLLDLCSNCVKRGKNVVILAHAKMRKFEQPDEMGAYDRWELKLSKQCAPITKEWADMVLFLNYKTIVTTTKDGKNKASGNKRIIHTVHQACWDAKNRHGLPEELPLEWGEELARIFPGQEPSSVYRAAETFDATVQQKMTNAQCVSELAKRGGYTDDSVLKMLKENQKCSPNATKLEDVDEAVLETVIQKWEQFKDFLELPF